MNDNYLEVLQHYDGETVDVRRGRGAWVCQRSDGLRLLKEYRGTLKRLEFEESILNELRALGISQVDQYVRNKEGELLTPSGDGTKYILKNWFSERECNLKDGREILFAVSQIARLHRAFKQISWLDEWNSGSMVSANPAEEMERHIREMKRTRTFISRKRRKNDFELCVIRHFETFYDQALQAQNGLELLRRKGEQNQLFLCHGDLNQHHILLGDEQAAFIEFNQMHRGIQMTDLYHFMRKVMEKHNWNEQLGLEMITSYDSVLPLRDEEREYLYFLFLYPEKYWKQLNFYYNANKAWIPEKNVEKLKNLENQEVGRRYFLSLIKG
ncbi:MAG: phosphotransferase [Lachnospiraceae bacterium]